jgi:hypothetical protein
LQYKRKHSACNVGFQMITVSKFQVKETEIQHHEPKPQNWENIHKISKINYITERKGIMRVGDKPSTFQGAPSTSIFEPTLISLLDSAYTSKKTKETVKYSRGKNYNFFHLEREITCYWQAERHEATKRERQPQGGRETDASIGAELERGHIFFFFSLSLSLSGNGA